MKDLRYREKKVGMTAFGYGKPENFSGYVPIYWVDKLYLNVESTAGYIFDTTSKYIKVPRSYYEKVSEYNYEFIFFRQFGVNISESPI